MPKKTTEDSFEVQKYDGKEVSPQDKFGAIYQIVSQMLRDSPAAGCRAAFVDGKLKLTYSVYVMDLPATIRTVEDQAKQILNATVSKLKKEYRALRGETLELKEDKKLADTSVEKVSQNLRHLYNSWRFYEMTGE